MSDQNTTKASKFLSYILRHHPDTIGLEIDPQGWAHLPSLIEKAQHHGRSLTRELIEQVMQDGDKQRFTLSDDGNYIRAGYGHSIDVDLDLEPTPPPGLLFHGTAKRNVDSILSEGLNPGSRNLVHLSDNKQDAVDVGSRHGSPQVLTIRSGQMYEAGNPFYQSDSEPNIWLVDEVPPRFIEG